MRFCKMLLLISIMLSTAGCIVLSIHPLHTKETVVFKSELIGSWYNEEEKSQLVFEKSEENSYLLTYTEKRSSGKFKVYVIQLHDALILDLYPEDLSDMNEFYRIHFMPMHSFARIWMEQDKIRFSILSYKWLKDSLEQKKIKIKYELEDDVYILTASTSELQKFIMKYVNSAEAFPEPLPFTRQKSEVPEESKK
jgi:hypothetical protein